MEFLSFLCYICANVNPFDMRKLAFLLMIIGICASCSESPAEYPYTIAHRGCWLTVHSQDYNGTPIVPENSLDAVRMARRFGYKAIELDPRVTSDSVLVVMHDKTINRTMCNASDLSEIAEPVQVRDHTFEDLRTNYVYKSTKPELRQQIPTLQELLGECKTNGIIPLMHCDIYEGYPVAKEFFGDDFIAFTSKFAVLKRVREISTCKILLDPSEELKNRGLEVSVENIVSLLEELGGNCGISSMKYELCSEEICTGLRARGYEVQSSIFVTPHELDAVRHGVTILLTDFCWYPSEGMKPADTSVMRVNGSAEWSGDEHECGAVVVEMRGKGEWDLVVNGERNYTIKRETVGTEIVTCRYCGRNASVSLVSKSGDRVSVKISDYSL